MKTSTKRTYNVESRQQAALQTRNRILSAAKMLFEIKGFDKVTIEKIAKKADVSTPTVYAVFKSKRGILLALLDSSLAEEKFNALVEQVKHADSASRRLELAASISRQLYDAEKAELNLLRGAFIVDPTLKELEAEREERRYMRQKETVEQMATNKAFKENLSLTEVRDIFWTFTGRDIYRLLVIERGWSADRYEAWLAGMLKETLLK